MSTPENWTYRPQLDGLRTVAVYLVLFFHAGMTWLSGGYVGVDLFFVLSGFLVTNVLVDDIRTHGRLRLGHFYGRRVRRLLPAALVLVTTTSAFFVLIASEARRSPLVGDARSALLYYSNWHFLAEDTDYFGADIERSPFLHFWSLSIEEQFYVFFPLLLLGLWAISRKRRWVLPAGLATLMVASVASQLYWAPRNVSHAYYATDTRIYQLLAGALLAVVLVEAPRRFHLVRAASFTAVGGLVGLLLLSSGVLDLSPSWRGILAALAGVSLVHGLMLRPGSPLSRVLSVSTVTYLGRISYGTYLWHWPVIIVLKEFLAPRPLWLGLAAAGIATGLAALSFEVVETPIRRDRRLGRRPWTVAVVGVATSAVLAVVVVTPLLTSGARPALAASPSAAAASGALSKQAVPDLDWDRINADIGPNVLCADTTPDDCVLHRGSGMTLLVVGDSQARSMVPMLERLAEEHDFTLAANVIPACAWQADVENLFEPADKRDLCTANRGDWYPRAIETLHPDVVLVSSRERDSSVWKDNLKRVSEDRGESLAELNLHTSEETLQTFRKSGARVVISSALMDTGDLDPLDCLSAARNQGECPIPLKRTRPLSDSFYESLAAQDSGMVTFDPTSLVCKSPPLCDPIVKGVVVWREKHHVTTKILIRLREEFWSRMESSGVLKGVE